MFRQKLLLTCLLFCAINAIFAQKASIQGRVFDVDDNRPLANASVTVEGTGAIAATDAKGYFELRNLNCTNCVVKFSLEGYTPRTITHQTNTTLPMAMEVGMVHIIITEEKPNEIPTVSLDEADADTDGAGIVSGVLNSGRDIFQRTAGFGWSVFRFRERGYDAEHYPLYLNGVNINDAETGNTIFAEFGGLNDVLRNRESTVGLEPAEFAFSEIGGASRIDTRASNQRKQIRFSYAETNRAYRHRVMLTANSGLMPGGWAVSASVSRRWAQEGYFDGTFFDGYSYFLSADKKFNNRHSLNLTFLGAPNIRGRVADSFQEMYDIAGTIRYNPNWGYQNGDKRNAATSHAHQPITMLRHDWSIGEKTSLLTSVYHQGGKRGDQRLEWFDALNPAPDYNRRLPSSFADPVQAAIWADLLRNSENLRQLDWHKFYDTNRNNIETIDNADGIQGNSITGKRSQYIVEDRRADSQEAGINTVLNQEISDRIQLQAGGNYYWYKGRNFKVMEDLLGGDFWVDVDKFAQQDFPTNPSAAYNNTAIPNDIIREGDVFGYDYDENIIRSSGWTQATVDFRKLTLMGGGTLNYQSFWRTGRMTNGRFPDSSLGDSEKQNFVTYGTKLGATYKINGRNYVYANAYKGTRSPQFRDVYLSPRTRNQVVANINPSDVQSIEGGFLVRAPRFKARLTGYMTDLKGEYESALLFQQSIGVFGTQVLSGVNRRHQGIEAAFEVKPFISWTFTGAANLGHYYYSSRPQIYVTVDNSSEEIIAGPLVYMENFLVPRVPQTTGSFAVRYEGKKFWFANLTLNYADDIWYEFDETRRTASFVENIEQGSEAWNTILDQKKAPSAFTLDLFCGKSWKVGENRFIYFNLGINNILNNQNIIISGRDAYRSSYRDIDDVRLYTSELTYAPGINYFASIAYRM